MKLPSGETMKIIGTILTGILLFILLEISTLPFPVFAALLIIVGGLWLFIAIKEMQRKGKPWYKQSEIPLLIALLLTFPTKYRYSTFQPLPTFFLIAILVLAAILFQRRHAMLYGPDDVDANDA